MRIGLVNCRYEHKKFNENLKTVDVEFGKYPPISLIYIASILENEKHDLLLIDAHAEKLKKEQILKRLNEFKPDILCFSFHSAYNISDTLEIINFLKRSLFIPVLVGGYNFNLYPSEHMMHKEIDYGLTGDCIETVPLFFKLFSDKKNLRKIPGLYYRENNKVKSNMTKHVSDNVSIKLEKLPLPDRNLLKNELYYQFISKRKNFTIMMTQTGCPYPCTFCAIPNYKYHSRSPEQVIEEIEDCYRNHSVREIDFFDATFTLDRERTMEICDLLKKSKLDIIWSCRTRIDKLDPILIRQMADSGCRRIYLGIESAEDKVLGKINKLIDRRKTIEVIRECNNNRINPLGFFMIGNPGDTKKSIRSTIELAKKLDIIYAQFSITIPKPKTDLERQVIKKVGFDYWSSFIKGEAEEKRLPNIGCNLSDKELFSLAKEAYIKFYFRPKIIIKNLIAIQSFHEFYRYLKASFKVFLE